MTTITIAAYGINEILTLYADPAWHNQIRKLAAFATYGERYDRAVVDTLRDMSDLYRRADGDERWIELARNKLIWCLERKFPVCA